MALNESLNDANSHDFNPPRSMRTATPATQHPRLELGVARDYTVRVAACCGLRSPQTSEENS